MPRPSYRLSTTLLIGLTVACSNGSIVDRGSSAQTLPGNTGGQGGGRRPPQGGAGGTSMMPATPVAKPPAPAVPPASDPVASSRFARLSHKQWEATVRDLLRLPSATGLGGTFITDPARAAFDNNGPLLQVAPALWTDYQRAAETLAERVVQDATALGRIAPANLPTEPDARARAFIESFGLRAYRRPLTPAEVAEHLMIYRQGPALIGSGDAWKDGVQLLLTLFLQSPNFLYRTELSTGLANGRIALTDHEIATRLSYGLWGTMPDDMLFAAAAKGELRTREGLTAQAKRLLASSRANAMVDDFHAQLLHMSRYDLISKDEKRFPNWKGGMGGDMRQETLRFVRDVVLTRDKGLTELLTAPYSFVNARLAPVYGLTTPAPPAMGQPDPGYVRVELDPGRRAGLLTQAGFLSAFADGREPNTILRGAFVTLDLLCVELPPPPDNVTALPPQVANKTNRQRIDAHTGPGTCGAGCHASLLNPAGYAFESFDALGQWRTMDANQPIDATGSFPLDGAAKSFNGPVEFARLIANSQQAHDCYARRWTEYLYGREIDAGGDKRLLTELGQRSLNNDHPVKAMLLDLVTTDGFVARAP